MTERPPSTDAPLVSVIVLNLNGERVIGRCLEHLREQTYPNYEVIVVDNGSTDGSVAQIHSYLDGERFSLVGSRTNRGCAGGRNLGLLHARGAIVAFIDNDGYADPSWLEEAVRQLNADATVGAVASVVFFNKKKLVLNGAGGSLTLLGYGVDLCVNTAYEFAELPHDVLYPMGCGMVIRRGLLDQMGPLDERLPNYYDDAELGVRIWRMGYRVVVAPRAWVDHEHSYSETFLNNKAILCEKGRVCLALKYYPLQLLLVWLWHELQHYRYYQYGRALLRTAWGWNLRNLGETLRIRRRFHRWDAPFKQRMIPIWRMSETYMPNSMEYQPDPQAAPALVVLDGVHDQQALNYGWYHPERDAGQPFRWMGRHAAAFGRVTGRATHLVARICSPEQYQQVRVVVRPAGCARIVFDHTLALEAEGWQWENFRLRCSLDRGIYEIVLIAMGTTLDRSYRVLGAAVAHVGFLEA